MKLRRPAIAFVWENFGPYHIDRLDAVASSLDEAYRVIGVEIAGSSATYSWENPKERAAFERITLYPNQRVDFIAGWRVLFSLLKVYLSIRPKVLFLCHYERIEIYVFALLVRLFGSKLYVMYDSKFDDKERSLTRECLKKLFFLPYNGALVSGQRSAEYLKFFGFGSGSVHYGYDTISVDRIRRLSGSAPAPDGIAFRDRHFTIVARLVSKKNISMALAAYALYSKMAGDQVRGLQICGSGDLDQSLRATASQLGVSNVVFRGFLQTQEIARTLSSSLALILPSVEDQWGLVVNEAVALGVPVLCSVNVGARDHLVRTGVTGHIFEPDNPEGLAQLLFRFGVDEVDWRRLAANASQVSALGDVTQFAGAVADILSGRAPKGPSCPQAVAYSSSRDVNARSPVRTWPKLFIAGAPKSGTTAIVEALEKFPEVYRSPVKEPNYFNPDVWVEDILPLPKRTKGHYLRKQFNAVVRSEEDYLSLYEDSREGQIVGDYSVNYLRSEEAPGRIWKSVKDAKIVIVLRNPIHRAYSHYIMDCKIGRVYDTFGNVISRHIKDVDDRAVQYDNYVQCGMYAKQIDRYIEVFGRDNVLILLYDDLVDGFDACILTICEHVGLSTEGRRVIKSNANSAEVAKAPFVNMLLYKSGVKKIIIRYCPEFIKQAAIKLYYSPHQRSAMSESEKVMLRDYFRDDIMRTEQVIGRSLRHWLE